MNIEEYKQLQDMIVDMEPYDYSNDIFKRSMTYMKEYMDSKGIKYKDIEERGKSKVQIYYKDRELSKFSIGRYPNNTFIGLRIANNKELTTQYLEVNNVPTPKTMVFNEKEKEKAFKFLSQTDTKVVIKPKNLSASLGVYLDVSESTFDYCWDSCVSIQKRYAPNSLAEMIIQEQVDGIEIRVNIVEGIVMNALVKMPWVIVGDGTKTIKEFIDDRNSEIKDHPLARGMIVKLTDEVNYQLNQSHKTAESVLDDGELFMISKIPVNRFGARKYNVAHLIHPNVIKLSLDAVKATPGLHTSGIDLFVPYIDSPNGLVLEVNKNPGTGASIHPMNGSSHSLLYKFMDVHMLEQRVLHEDINSLDDLSNDELKILLERFRFLYGKDKMNTRIITKLHKEFIEDIR